MLLLVTTNNGYNPFLQKSSGLYPSLYHPVRSGILSSAEEVYHNHQNAPNFFPGSTFVQYQNYGTNQKASLYYSDSDYLPGYGTSNEMSDGCGIVAPSDVFQSLGTTSVIRPSPVHRNEYSLQAASEPEPSAANGSKLNTWNNGAQRYFSDNGGLLSNHKESFYHNPPSPAPGENGGKLDLAKSSLMQNG